MFSVEQSGIDVFLEGIDGDLLHNEPMTKHSHWQMGGVAQCFFPARGKTEVVQLMCQLPGNIPVYWYGAGHNTLVRDGGIKGVTLGTNEGLSSVELVAAHRLYAQCGIANVQLAHYCKLKGFTGLEFLASIPGTLGGAMAMTQNEPEKWRCIKRIECVNRDGDITWCKLPDLPNQLQASEAKKQAWILGVEFEFSRPKRHSAMSLLRRYAGIAVQKQARATGIYQQSGDIDPSKLLKQAGLAGFAIGGARFDPEHPNQLIVAKNASVKQVEELVELGRQRVLEEFDVPLHALINFVGERQ